MVQNTRDDAEPGRLPAWVAWLLYAVFAIGMTWPLVTSLGTQLGGTDQDILNVYWGNWWVPRALFSGQDIYYTNALIYPVGFDLTSFAFSPLLAVVAMTFDWIFSSIVAYNLLFLIVIVVSCGAMDQLVRYLTGNPWAALVGGITFGFAPILAGHRAAHLNMAAIMWLPWAALLLIRIMREAKIRDALFLAIVARLTFLTRLQVGVLAALFCGVVFVGLWIAEHKDWGRRAWLCLALATGLSLVLLSPLIVKIAFRLSMPDGGGAVVEASPAEADVLSYVTPVPEHPLFGRWTTEIYDRYPATVSLYWSYVGFVPLALAAIAVITKPRRALPWMGAGLGFFVLALGSKLRFNGEVYADITLPYGWLADLFAVAGFDRPDRFNLAMASGFAVLVGFGADWICRRLSKPWLIAIGGALILFEYTAVPIQLFDPPPHSPFYDEMAADREPYAVVDLPLTRAAGEIHRYYQTIHNKQIVGGWDHRVPEIAMSFIDVDPLLSTWRGSSLQPASLFNSLEHLKLANVRYFILHKDQLGGFPAAMEHLYLSVKPVYEDSDVYVLPTDGRTPSTLHISEMSNAGYAYVQPLVTPRVIDGVPGLVVNTCWLPMSDTVGNATGCRVALISPEREVVARKAMDFPAPLQEPTCEQWFMELDPEVPNGTYEIDMMLYGEDGTLDTAKMYETVHLATGAEGELDPWLGVDYPISFDAPIEMLGYRIQASDDVLILDTTWHSLTDHDGSYAMFLQLLDPVTRLPVVRSSDDIIPRLTWLEGSTETDHRIIMLNDVEPGRYELAIGIYPSEHADQRIAAYINPDGDTWPGAQAVLRTRVLVLPDAWRDTPEISEDRVVVYTKSGTSGTPTTPMSASFGTGIEFQGYGLDATSLVAGQPFDLTLYWQAVECYLLDAGYRVFVHVIDEAGQLVAQHDGDPAQGQQPTTTWQNGDRILDVHHVVWSTAPQGNTMTIKVGMYDPQTLERLPAYGADGSYLADEQLELGQFQLRIEETLP